MQHIPLENVFLAPKAEGETHSSSEQETSLNTDEEAHCSSEQDTDYIPQHHDIHYKHPDVDHGWAYVVLVAMFCAFFINGGKMVPLFV